MVSGNKGGFTLIEILIVVMIIGILAAVAIPAYLGQKTRAGLQAMASSAKTVEKEFVLIMDNFSKQEPIVLTASGGDPGCYEYPGVGKKDMCSTTYKDLPKIGTYNTIQDIMAMYVVHSNEGLQQKSPLDGTPLMTDDAGARSGHVLIANISDKGVYVSSWDLLGSMISNSFIGSR